MCVVSFAGGDDGRRPLSEVAMRVTITHAAVAIDPRRRTMKHRSVFVAVLAGIASMSLSAQAPPAVPRSTGQTVAARAYRRDALGVGTQRCPCTSRPTTGSLGQFGGTTRGQPPASRHSPYVQRRIVAVRHRDQVIAVTTMHATTSRAFSGWTSPRRDAPGSSARPSFQDP